MTVLLGGGGCGVAGCQMGEANSPQPANGVVSGPGDTDQPGHPELSAHRAELLSRWTSVGAGDADRPDTPELNAAIRFRYGSHVVVVVWLRVLLERMRVRA